jgi:hypothetical protein
LHIGTARILRVQPQCVDMISLSHGLNKWAAEYVHLRPLGKRLF